MKVYQRNGMMHYVYKCSEDFGFHFHLLEEVGEPWQAEAREKVRQLEQKLGRKRRQVELDVEPWYVDVI